MNTFPGTVFLLQKTVSGKDLILILIFFFQLLFITYSFVA